MALVAAGALVLKTASVESLESKPASGLPWLIMALLASWQAWLDSLPQVLSASFLQSLISEAMQATSAAIGGLLLWKRRLDQLEPAHSLDDFMETFNDHLEGMVPKVTTFLLHQEARLGILNDVLLETCEVLGEQCLNERKELRPVVQLTMFAKKIRSKMVEMQVAEAALEAATQLGWMTSTTSSPPQ